MVVNIVFNVSELIFFIKILVGLWLKIKKLSKVLIMIMIINKILNCVWL